MNIQQVHVSKMTGKLEGFKAISTNTTSNPFCIKMFRAKKDTICKNCYSHIMLTSYRKNMVLSHEPEGEVIKEEEKKNPTFVQFMQRIEQLPEVTREAIKNCGNDPAIAKAALEISGIDK